ncbi:F-box only protein 4-like [Plakobranchus ocellatus]|uniref:F-box only protein 4-like n=1 Tax=Plakobranchus ocellatus TaxID=259542 RepID=A0AAV3ZUK0_9GAST|nr:F-box only protein 4-like [Plakobranchus ocellatus]
MSIYLKKGQPNVAAVLQSREDEGSLFQSLPVDLKMAVFSLLDAKSLCLACCVCREWRIISSDNSLWRRLLQRDIRQWSQISNVTNPRLYLEMDSDWSQKEIYLKCSPVVQQQLKVATSTFQQVSSYLKSFIPRKVPKVAMFGPGLETSTSGVVRRILYEENNIFRRIALFPGQFDGVGGGMTLRLPSRHTLHLSVLYSASKQERERREGHDRLEGNKLLQKRDGDQNHPECQVSQYELKPQIRHLCMTLDAFIFVVDATQTQETVSASCAELQAMLRERKFGLVPVLILSCVPRPEDVRLSADDVVSCLKMETLTQPWLVINCVTETLASIDQGIVWLVEQAQIR